MKILSLPRLTSVALATMALAFCHTAVEAAATGNMPTNSELQQEGSQSAQKDGSATSTSLAKQLSDTTKARMGKAPAKMKKAFKEAIDTVRNSGIEKSAKQVGDAAIDAKLTGWDGKEVQLSELWSEGPVVLMWYRGGWCPFCNIQLRAMQQSLDDLDNAGAKLVVLTPELPEKAKQTAEANDLDIVALHDSDNQLAAKYGIMYDLPEPIVPMYRDRLKLASFNGNEKMQLPLSATYVIDKSGKITYAFLDADYKKRAEPADIIKAVKAAAK